MSNDNKKLTKEEKIKKQKEDEEANMFAFGFLMPADLVKQKLYELGDEGDIVDITSLAKYFGVSVDVMRKRCKDLDLIV